MCIKYILQKAENLATKGQIFGRQYSEARLFCHVLVGWAAPLYESKKSRSCPEGQKLSEAAVL